MRAPVPSSEPVPTPVELLLVATEAVDRASRIIRDRPPSQVTMKGDRDPATDIDYAIEREIRNFLLDQAPSVGFLGEEDGQYGDISAEMWWALDPVDGTINFIHGVPLCGVSLGLIHRNEPVLGVIDLPALNLRYSAALGDGAFCGRTPIRIRETASLKDAVVALGDYAVGADAIAKNAKCLRVTGGIAAVAQRVRMFGSAAVDLAWVAEGRISASVMLDNKPWDTAAGIAIAREAGAVVIDDRGERHNGASMTTIAAAPLIAYDLARIVRAANLEA